MADLIDTTEMYLRTIYELEEEGIVPLRARIAERLDHSGPTVSQTIARMERDGLVRLNGDRQLVFTEEGLARASQVMRKHRLAERLLSDVIGLEYSAIHDEACRWEHVMSDQVEDRLLSILESAETSPFGTPIPAGQGTEPVVPRLFEGEKLSEAAQRPGTFQVLLVTEGLQSDPEILGQLSALGIVPGATIGAEPSVGYIAVWAVDGSREPGSSSSGGIELSPDTADHLRVQRIEN